MGFNIGSIKSCKSCYLNFTFLQLASGVQSGTSCAVLCSQTKQCNAIAYSATKSQCFLYGVVNQNMCDPTASPSCSSQRQALYVPPSSACSSADCQVFFRDDSLMYCTPNANRCACYREYTDCLVRTGCEVAVESQEVRFFIPVNDLRDSTAFISSLMQELRCDS